MIFLKLLFLMMGGINKSIMFIIIEFSINIKLNYKKFKKVKMVT